MVHWCMGWSVMSQELRGAAFSSNGSQRGKEQSCVAILVLVAAKVPGDKEGCVTLVVTGRSLAWETGGQGTLPVSTTFSLKRE